MVLYNGTPPSGITEGSIYYVRDADADTLKLFFGQNMVTLANGICLVGSVIKEIAGTDIADQLSGTPVSDDTMSALISSEFNKAIIAKHLPGA